MSTMFLHLPDTFLKLSQVEIREILSFFQEEKDPKYK